MNLDQKLSFINKLNGLKIGGIGISNYFVYRGYSLWSFVQQRIWMDMDRLGNLKYDPLIKDSLSSGLRVSLLRFLAIILSLFSIFILKIKKPRVLIFSTDSVSDSSSKSDGRMSLVYRALEDMGVGFGEVVHISLNSKFGKNFFFRRRPVIYLEAINYCYPLLKYFIKEISFLPINLRDLDLSGFSETEREIAEVLIKDHSASLDILPFRIKVLSLLFQLIGPEFIFSIDDSRYYHEILLAGEITKIPTHAFQHGRFNKYIIGPRYLSIDPDLCILPDFFYVWNEYWRNKLISLSEPFSNAKDRILIGGSPSLSTSIYSGPGVDDGVITILVPYEVGIDKGILADYLVSFLECNNVHIIIKLRSDIDENIQLERTGLFRFKNNPRVIFTTDLSDINGIDLVVGSYSTFLYEMVAIGKPVGVLEMDTTQAWDLIEDGLAEEISQNNLNNELIKKIASTPSDILKIRSGAMNSSHKIRDTIENIIKSAN